MWEEACRMLGLLLLVLAKCAASSGGFSDVLASFMLDATPALFAPVRLSVHACLREDDNIALSRQLSRNHFAHEIHDSFADFDGKVYFDPLDHQSLRILDLQCDYALRILLAANSRGMFVAPAKWLLLDDRRSDPIDIMTSSTGDNVLEIFEELAAYPDSDVLLASRLRDDFVTLTSIYRPSPERSVILEDRGNWSTAGGVKMRTLEMASRRRRNLQLTPLKSCLVMTDPNTINHLTDYQDKHIDAVTKVGYPRLLLIAERMNATVTFNVTNTWGYRDENGTWNGLTGMLQRREIDIGGTATFFISERIGVVQYVQLYTHTKSRFIFKQPLLSSVSNIFTLPFQRSVWIAIGIFLLLVLILLYLSTKWEYHRGASPSTVDYWKQMNPSEPTLSDNFLVVLGAMAQQGYSYVPYRVPARIVTLMLLIAALSLYASYTANIVALLQSTTNAIKTPSDLLNSPLKLGVEDVIYNRYYFKSFQDTTRRTIVEQKIESKGHKSSWMSIKEGVHNMRNGLFAFHGEAGVVYKMMQETFQEEEKCGITEIDFLNVLDPLLIIPMRSPYLEIIKNIALILRESGLKFRSESRIYTDKPKCNGGTSFISIGLTECYFALVTLGYGVLLTILVLLGESLWFKWRKTAYLDLRIHPLSLEFIEEQRE